MQKEKGFFLHYIEFVYIQDFEKVSWKIVCALLEHEVLDSNVNLYEIDYYKF